MNYFTPYTRLLIKHATGAGKTLSALLIAKSFIANNQKVLIIGYGKERFFRDALQYH